MGLPHPLGSGWPGQPGRAGYLPLVDVPLGAALPAGAGPDGGALEGEDLSWAEEAAGVFCCKGTERSDCPRCLQ